MAFHNEKDFKSEKRQGEKRVVRHKENFISKPKNIGLFFGAP